MGKRRINLFPLMIASILVLAVTVCLSLYHPVIEFGFLDGLTPVWQGTWNGKASEIYRFDRDFDEVCVEAAAELTDLGFAESGFLVKNRGRGQPVRYRYTRFFIRHGHNDEVQVQIEEINGKVVVEVRRQRRRLSLGRWLRHVLGRDRRGRPPTPPSTPPPP